MVLPSLASNRYGSWTSEASGMQGMSWKGFGTLACTARVSTCQQWTLPWADGSRCCVAPCWQASRTPSATEHQVVWCWSWSALVDATGQSCASELINRFASTQGIECIAVHFVPTYMGAHLQHLWALLTAGPWQVWCCHMQSSHAPSKSGRSKSVWQRSQVDIKVKVSKAHLSSAAASTAAAGDTKGANGQLRPVALSSRIWPRAKHHRHGCWSRPWCFRRAWVAVRDPSASVAARPLNGRTGAGLELRSNAAVQRQTSPQQTWDTWHSGGSGSSAAAEAAASGSTDKGEEASSSLKRPHSATRGNASRSGQSVAFKEGKGRWDAWSEKRWLMTSMRRMADELWSSSWQGPMKIEFSDLPDGELNLIAAAESNNVGSLASTTSRRGPQRVPPEPDGGAAETDISREVSRKQLSRMTRRGAGMGAAAAALTEGRQRVPLKAPSQHSTSRRANRKPGGRRIAEHLQGGCSGQEVGRGARCHCQSGWLAHAGRWSHTKHWPCSRQGCGMGDPTLEEQWWLPVLW